jgi:hypothetical protein
MRVPQPDVGQTGFLSRLQRRVRVIDGGAGQVVHHKMGGEAEERIGDTWMQVSDEACNPAHLFNIHISWNQ